VAAASPPRGMVRHCVRPQGRPKFVGTGQQGFSAPRVHVHIFLQAETRQSRGWRRPLRGTWTGIVGHLCSRDLHSHACQVESIMSFHGVSPPQPSISAGAQRFSTEQLSLALGNAKSLQFREHRLVLVVVLQIGDEVIPDQTPELVLSSSRDDDRQEHAEGIDQAMPLTPLEVRVRIIAAEPPGPLVLLDCLSMIPALRWRRLPATPRTSPRSRSCLCCQVPSFRQRRQSW